MKKNQRRIKSGGIDALDETVDFEYGEYNRDVGCREGWSTEKREREGEGMAKDVDGGCNGNYQR